ncbi:MAG: nucleotidyl transferase AbiEii/AbiGii toxin family protein [Coriobacteriia bacterium]|nr:nucleotidyl transferase AbiEii/AbiGii toxin family protein [Coriobacteriia bacterium]
MKDYHDIWVLSRTLEFDGPNLSDAIRATFQRRDTDVLSETPAELMREYTGQPETSQVWDTYRKGFSASTSDLPEDLQ